ncbi:MAG: hypothetical protein GWP14_09760 [Actinobacteria bacterium]|nr:hypothetical protein [Actinomycetota bacterium]
MIEEFRVYELYPGKLEAFKERFEKYSKPIFARHGIELLGFWEVGEYPKDAKPQVSEGGTVKPAVGSKFGIDRFAYMVRFKSLEQRDAAWQAFVKDDEWLARRAESEVDGALVASEHTTLLLPVQE